MNSEQKIHEIEEKMFELREIQAAYKAEEYHKLAARSLLVVIITLILQLTNHSTEITNQWKGILLFGGFGLVLIFIITTSLVRALHSKLGIAAYIKLEKELLINEMPNIFQIMSLLGFLNVFLQNYIVRFSVTVIITFLLSIYLTSKRRDMIAGLPHAMKVKIATNITASFSLSLALIIGTIVFALASLISAQIHA